MCVLQGLMWAPMIGVAVGIAFGVVHLGVRALDALARWRAR